MRPSGTWVLAGLLCVTAVAQETKPTFETASVKRQRAPLSSEFFTSADPRIRPGGILSATHATVASLAMFAYDLKSFQIIDGPGWLRSDYFQIEAKAGGDASRQRVKEMTQSLLRERFKLQARRVQREMRIHELVRTGQTRAGLKRCADPSVSPPDTPIRIPAGAYPFPIMAWCDSLQPIVTTASDVLEAVVTDKTGLEGRWTYTVVFANPAPRTSGPVQEFVDRQNVPSLTVALQEELGLTLKATRGPVDVLVIDSVQQPTEN